jgi:hypothetical protein
MEKKGFIRLKMVDVFVDAEVAITRIIKASIVQQGP